MSDEELNKLMARREYRKHQRNSRGGKRSATDQFEDACIVVAWIQDQITEGQMSQALGIDRVSARQLAIDCKELGRSIALRVHQKRTAKRLMKMTKRQIISALLKPSTAHSPC